jgi:hypothetical protein
MSSPSVAGPSLSVLRSLSLEPLVPTQLSSRGHAMSAFKKIVAVRVVCDSNASPGKRKFVLEVFTGESCSRIPTFSNHGPLSSLPTRSAPSNQPTSAITKSLDDFADLREQLYAVAHNAHEGEQCEFCRDMIEYSLYSNMQPNALTRLFVDNERMLQSLTRFVSDLVPKVVTGCSAATGRGTCRAQTKIPRLLHQFLFGLSSETTD